MQQKKRTTTTKMNRNEEQYQHISALSFFFLVGLINYLTNYILYGQSLLK